MSLLLKQVVLVAVVAGAAAMVGVVLFRWTGSRLTAAVVAAVIGSVAGLLGNQRISSAQSAARSSAAG
jgi:hypothetical protein